MVSSGVVRSAVIDEVWNEMEVLDAPVLYVTPDMFPDFAIQYILNNLRQGQAGSKKEEEER